MPCPHPLWETPDGLSCQRSDPHATGHVYTATWSPDGHDESEARACETTS
jgi:hypothetical protein